jgi:hypothetical protein
MLAIDIVTSASVAFGQVRRPDRSRAKRGVVEGPFFQRSGGLSRKKGPSTSLGTTATRSLVYFFVSAPGASGTGEEDPD